MRIETIDDGHGANSWHHHRVEEVVEDRGLDSCFVCDREADLALSDPDDVDATKYCSPEHKGFHYGDHRPEAFPFTVRFRDGVGRFMVASRDIEAGELIFAEDPLAMGPNHFSLPCCLDCMREVKGGYRCPNCNLPVCEEMCAYGEEHSKECAVFSALDPKLEVPESHDAQPDRLFMSITVLRTLLLKESDPAKYSTVRRMMDHNDAGGDKGSGRRRDTWDLYKCNVVDVLRIRCGLKDKYTEEEIFHVLGALDVNSVKIHASSSQGPPSGSEVQGQARPVFPGHALFALTALMSHDCMANSRTIINNDYSCECRATVDIRRGQEITKQYTSPLEATAERRAKLLDGWFFECRCPRCRDPAECGSFMGAARCLRCNGQGVILPEDPLLASSGWRCDFCLKVYGVESVRQLVTYFEEKLGDPRVASSVKEMEEVLEKACKLLHENHHVVLKAKIRLNVAYVRLSSRLCQEAADPTEDSDADPRTPTEVYMRRKELLDSIQQVLDIVEPGLSRRRGLALFESATCRLQLARQLYEEGRFSGADFLKVLDAEREVLEDCVRCLEHSREGTQEAAVLYRARGAIYEADCMVRNLKVEQDKSSPAGALVPLELPGGDLVGEEMAPEAVEDGRRRTSHPKIADGKSKKRRGGKR